MDHVVYTVGNAVLAIGFAVALSPDSFGQVALVTLVGILLGSTLRVFYAEPASVFGEEARQSRRTVVLACLVVSTSGGVVTSVVLLPAVSHAGVDWGIRAAGFGATAALVWVEVARGLLISIRHYRQVLIADAAWLFVGAFGVAVVGIWSSRPVPALIVTALGPALAVGYLIASSATSFEWSSRRPVEYRRSGAFYLADFLLLNGTTQLLLIAVGLSAGAGELGGLRVLVATFGPLTILVRATTVSLLPILSSAVRQRSLSTTGVTILVSSALGIAGGIYGSIVVLGISGGLIDLPALDLIATSYVVLFAVSRVAEAMAVGPIIGLKLQGELARPTALRAVGATGVVGGILFLRSRLDSAAAISILAFVSLVSLAGWIILFLTAGQEGRDRDLKCSKTRRKSRQEMLGQ